PVTATGETEAETPLPELTESYADSLIDEVFEEVDRMLENGVAVLDGADSQRRRPSTRGRTQDADETGLIPVDPASLQPDLDIDGIDFETGTPLDADAASAAHLDAAPSPRQPLGPIALLTSLLPILVACASLGLALSAGLALYNQRQKLADAPAAVDAAPSADAEFLAYMNQALEVISQKAAAEDAGAIASESTTDTDTAAAQDGSPDSGNPPVLVNPLPMPIFQPPQSIASLPTVPIQESLTPPSPVPTNPVPANPVPVTPAPSTFPATPPASPAPAASADPAPAPNIAPAANHTLVGLLQLGDRSAAIFEFDGNAQRIAVGERIGSSGWSLVSVSNDEAIIRRNGEVRSIYIGQSF
ncbi:MAG: hypothetical protein VKK04_18780, partial [Synechococcales bacterium]|nr:hypothetical protein [Synechococcales bacterium]